MLLPSRAFIFGIFRFKVPTRELLRVGDDGSVTPIPLGLRAADLLLLFLERPGELVTKDQIMDAVWPGMVVEESNLPVQISAIRRALDPGRNGDSCILNVPRRGYRFTLNVEEERQSEGESAVGASAAPNDANGTSVEPGPAQRNKPSITVMPFNNTSGAPERRHRSGGTGAVSRRTVLAGAGSTVALGLGGLVYMLWPRSFVADAKFAGTHRTALVIGNAQYRIFPPLDNPVRDADSVSAALEQRGFRVIKLTDADGRQTTEAVTDFERTLSVVGGIGIFYYAGRAIYNDGEDILMPVDVKLNSAKTKLEGGVNLTTLQAQVQAKITRKFVSDGSAVIYSASKGESADDGPPGKHSPFTTAFLEALTHDEDELGDLFRRIRQTMDKEPSETTKKQTPYFEDSRRVKFHFNRPKTDMAIGALKILIFDSCRDNPLNLSTDGRYSLDRR